MIWKPRATVAVVTERDGRFLVVEEHIQGARLFNQPAGHLEDNESLIEAAVRECLEETGWRLVPEGVIGLYRWRNPATQDTFLRVTFFGRCVRHEADRELDPDISAVHWMSPGEISALAGQLRSPLVMASLQDYLAGKRYPLDIINDINESE
jgi:8-oxo-dGTP pyrophosphatase MutT (NUDIX family)